MKIIQVVGRANTGKTTFITHLIPALKPYGRVGVIKHLGDHDFRQEEGKDTTIFFENEADISAGIDADKSVVALRTIDLDHMLHLFKHQGIDFAVIEGFKARPFPKIVIGDLPSESCILRNPTVREVVSDFSRFEDY
ncbi:molybdopterin-guanine dinucleotide biosynthesis protein B [Methanoregula sp.]|uniref:molybdopterin-guanine dinucleotide biosynthesis protein B n=1 Tax=Methanoregula sp. TaxID=2052170 RepID=UPI002BCE1435|nr:molybdopterin-guanine dinucleotide biosynthesis protein B [Methanoregula sp.]HVP96683.1 molybdopterin-guanine dinucleotide biosynthesis protein B [Methanoregula sp.]